LSEAVRRPHRDDLCRSPPTVARLDCSAKPSHPQVDPTTSFSTCRAGPVGAHLRSLGCPARSNPHPGSMHHERNRVPTTSLEASPEPARPRRLEPGFQNLATPHTSQCLLLRDAGERDLFGRCLRDAALESTWVPQLHRLWEECRAGGFCLDGPGREPFGHLCPSFDFFVHSDWLAGGCARSHQDLLWWESDGRVAGTRCRHRCLLHVV